MILVIDTEMIDWLIDWLIWFHVIAVTESATSTQQRCRLTSASVAASRQCESPTWSQLQFSQHHTVEQPFDAHGKFRLRASDKLRYADNLQRTTSRRSWDGFATFVRPWPWPRRLRPWPHRRPRPSPLQRVRPGTQRAGKPGVFPRQLRAVCRSPTAIAALRPHVLQELIHCFAFASFLWYCFSLRQGFSTTIGPCTSSVIYQNNFSISKVKHCFEHHGRNIIFLCCPWWKAQAIGVMPVHFLSVCHSCFFPVLMQLSVPRHSQHIFRPFQFCPRADKLVTD